MDTENISEEEAIKLYYEWSQRFGWAGTFFTRADADQSWSEYHDQPGELSDDQWSRVCDTWEWRKGIGGSLTEYGWDIVHEALRPVVRDSQE